MNCNLIKTERLHSNGSPYWVCSRADCSNRCVSLDGKCKVGKCKSTDLVAIAEALEQEKANPKKCLPCEQKAKKYGLGDLVADGIKVATLGLVKPCGGCGKRQAALNKLLPNVNPFGSKTS